MRSRERARLGPGGLWGIHGPPPRKIIRSLRPVVDQLKTYDANAADQVVRAATSITHNVAEGSRRSGKDQKRFYRIATGSAQEVMAALDTAEA